MKILVTTASPWSGLADTAALLAQAGLQAAQAAPLGGEAHQTVADWHTQLLQTLDLHPDGLNATGQLPVGRLWEDMALGLLRANLGQADWFMADTRATWTLEFWAGVDPQARFLLLYLPAEAALHAARAQAQHSGGDAAEAWDATACAQAWLAHNRELLRLSQALTARTLLVNAQQAVLHPQRLAHTLATALGVQARSAADWSEWDAPIYLNAPIEALVAPGLAAELRAMNRQLRDAQTPLLTGGTQLVLSNADETVHKSTGLLGWLGFNNKHAEQALASLGNELAHTQVDLAHTQDLLSILVLKKERLEHRLASAEHAQQHTHAALEQANATLQAKNAELAQTLAELNHATSQLHHLRADLEAAVNQAKQAADQAHVSQKALSSEKAELQQESELLLAQLHQVQEELETIFLDREDLKQQLATTEQAKNQAETSRAEAEQARNEAQEQAAALVQQAQAAQAAQQQAESARAQAEAGRAQAEQAKNQAEASRVEAEHARNEAQTRVAALAQQAQAAQAAQQQAESARSQSEAGRAQAEQAKNHADEARVAAEKARSDAENKATAVTQQLHAAQASQAQAESARVAAEQAKAQADRDRSEADKTRTEAEQKTAELTVQLTAAKTNHPEKDKALQEAREENELLLKQLHQVQEELETYFLKHQEIQQAQTGVTERLNRLLQRLPTWADAEHLSAQLVLNEPEHRCLRVQARQVWIGQDAPLASLQFLFGVRDNVPYLEFRPGNEGVPKHLFPWPADLSDDKGSRLLLAPTAPPPVGPMQADIVAQLTASQWRLIRSLLVLVGSHIGRLGQAVQADRVLWADTARQLTQKLEELSPGLHHEGVEVLAVAQPVPGLETIRLAIKQVNTRNVRIPLLVFELGLQHKTIKGKHSPQAMYLEFRQWKAAVPPFAGWKPNGQDAQGPFMRLNYPLKGKQRPQPPELAELTLDDQALLASIQALLPMELGNAQLSRFTMEISSDGWIAALCQMPYAPKFSLVTELNAILQKDSVVI